MSPNLIFVKHSLPEIVPGLPAAEWHLSEEGRRRCAPLARVLAGLNPDGLVSSQEPKALETARLAARHLGLPVCSFPDLHEHTRRSTDFTTPDVFQQQVSALFREPGRLVFGEETADQAHARFAAAVTTALAESGFGNPAIVTHGTVISLFVSRITGQDPFPLWRSLGLPAIVSLSLDTQKIERIVEEIVS